jgi:hypothetical protein
MAHRPTASIKDNSGDMHRFRNVGKRTTMQGITFAWMGHVLTMTG